MIKINSNQPSGSYGQSDTYVNLPKNSSQAQYNENYKMGSYQSIP